MRRRRWPSAEAPVTWCAHHSLPAAFPDHSCFPRDAQPRARTARTGTPSATRAGDLARHAGHRPHRPLFYGRLADGFTLRNLTAFEATVWPRNCNSERCDPECNQIPINPINLDPIAACTQWLNGENDAARPCGKPGGKADLARRVLVPTLCRRADVALSLSDVAVKVRCQGLTCPGGLLAASRRPRGRDDAAGWDTVDQGARRFGLDVDAPPLPMSRVALHYVDLQARVGTC